jgi:dUTP pyrophosphatase
MLNLTNALNKRFPVTYEPVDPKYPVFKYNAGTLDDPGDVGYDLHYLGEDIILRKGEVYTLGTNLKINMPKFLYLKVTDRSGLASEGLHVFEGTIDPNFRGQVGVICTPLVRDIFIKKGERIAQGIFGVYCHPMLRQGRIEVDTERGGDGFGSSGL